MNGPDIWVTTRNRIKKKGVKYIFFPPVFLGTKVECLALAPPPIYRSSTGQFYPIFVVLILYGNSEHVVHACRKLGLLETKKIRLLSI